MVNAEVRKYAMLKGLKQWEVAKALGVSESHLCRKLRYELPQSEKMKIIEAIDQATGGEVDG